MHHILRPTKTVTRSGGDSSKGTGWAEMTVVEKAPAEWTEAERDFMEGRNPATAPLDRRIAQLEAFVKSIRHASVLFSDGYMSEGIAQINASLDHLSRHALPIAEVT